MGFMEVWRSCYRGHPFTREETLSKKVKIHDQGTQTKTIQSWSNDTCLSNSVLMGKVMDGFYQLFGPKGGPRSLTQLRSIVFGLETHYSLLILPTGSGKSLMFTGSITTPSP